MTTARAHTQLSTAIRSLARARTRLQSGHLTWFGRLLYRYRCAFLANHIQQLVHELHSAPTSTSPMIHN